VVKGGSIYQPGEAVKGSTAVVSRYLSRGYLWDVIRVVGGAYGGSGSFSATSGRFIFSSYRDPNVLDTLETYDDSPTQLLDIHKRQHLEEDITQAIIGAIGDLDSPLFVDQKGEVALRQYLRQENHSERVQWRQEIIQTTPDDFISFGRRLESLGAEGGAVVFGSKSALEGANEILQSKGKQQFLLQPAFGNSAGGEAMADETNGEDSSGEE
jgi:presequence protease